MKFKQECYLIVKNDRLALPVAPPMTAKAAAEWLGVNINHVYHFVAWAKKHGEKTGFRGPYVPYYVVKVDIETNDNNY